MPVHKLLLGDKHAAAGWLPFAMGRLKVMRRVGTRKAVYRPFEGVLIDIDRVTKQERITIRAKGGEYILVACRDSEYTFNEIYRIDARGGRVVTVAPFPCFGDLPEGTTEWWLTEFKIHNRRIYGARVVEDDGGSVVSNSFKGGDCRTLVSLDAGVRRVALDIYAGGSVLITQAFTNDQWAPEASMYQSKVKELEEVGPGEPITITPYARITDVYSSSGLVVTELDDAYDGNGDGYLEVGDYRAAAVFDRQGNLLNILYLGQPAPLVSFWDASGLLGYTNAHNTQMCGTEDGMAIVHSNPGPETPDFPGDGNVYLYMVNNLGEFVSNALLGTLSSFTDPSIIASSREITVMLPESEGIKVITFARQPEYDESGTLIADNPVLRSSMVVGITPNDSLGHAVFGR